MSHPFEHPVPSEQPLRGEVVFESQSAAGNKAVPAGVTLLVEGLSLMMDRLFLIPGTKQRFGLNSVFLLVPVVGDLVPTLISFGIVYLGVRTFHLPRIIVARMLCNTVLDAGIGWLPVVGPLFDVWFKADTRNVQLLRQYAELPAEKRSNWWHWVVVLGMLGIVMLVLGSVGYAAIALGSWLFGAH